MSACKFSVKLIMRNRLLYGRFRNQDFRSQNNYILHLDGFGGLGTTLSDHYATKTLDPTRSGNFEPAGGRISAVSLRLRCEVVEGVPRGGFVVLLARAAQPFSTGGPPFRSLMFVLFEQFINCVKMFLQFQGFD